jgi:hypothetical protein
MRSKSLVLVTALLLVPLAALAGGFVPGTSNPFLAGMPSGSTCCGGDTAPAQSPVLAGAVTPGTFLTFTVTGSVNNDAGPSGLTPDGGALISTVSNNGIAGADWPINALVGVFLDDSQPDSSSAPSQLSFGPAEIGTSFTTLSPSLKQAFFIGDGLTGTGTGSAQTFRVPVGATRLFLGTSDGFGWANNTGGFAFAFGVQGPAPTPTSTPQAGPSSPVPTLSFPMIALLGLAIAGTAIFLIRRG